MTVRLIGTLATLLLAAPAAATGQGGIFDSIPTPRGMCRVWIGIPGGSTHNKDGSYAPCAVDRPAQLLVPPSLPQPPAGTGIRADFTVVVRADGTVDPRLTRPWSTGSEVDSITRRTTLEGLRAWRFRPALKDGRAVRSGFKLDIRTDARVDTLPSRIRWSYLQDPIRGDSLIGHWEVVAERPPPLSRAALARADSALFQRLLQMRVLAPWLGRPYCIVQDRDDDDEAGHARRAQALRNAFLTRSGRHGGYYDPEGEDEVLPRGCEREPGAIRLFLPRLHRTEGSRVVVYPAGDFLESWPPGSRQPTSLPGWKGRCVLAVTEGGPVPVHCEIQALYSFSYHARLWEDNPEPHWYRKGDSIRVTVIARMNHAYQSDTLHAVVTDLRRFAESSILDHDSACASMWQVFTPGTRKVFVAMGDLEDRFPSFRLTEGVHRPVPSTPPVGCSGGERASLLSVFMLGDLGEAPSEPVTLCVGPPLCARHYRVDPRRHTLAGRAALRFGIQELREMSRVGDQLRFTLTVDPVPEGLMPLVMVRSGSAPPYSLWPLRRVEQNLWEFGVTYDPSISLESELSLYLVAR